MKVQQIEATDTYKLRHHILRNGQPIETCRYPGDNDDNAFHLGAFKDGKLVSVASFYLENHPSLKDEYQYRLRGMATLPEYRGQGLSRELLRVAFPLIKRNFCTSVWCNARVGALGFYEKVGFERRSDEFLIDPIGTHVLMNKTI